MHGYEHVTRKQEQAISFSALLQNDLQLAMVCNISKGTKVHKSAFAAIGCAYNDATGVQVQGH